MAEYIIDWPHGDSFERCFGHPPEKLMGFTVKQPIVRCRDCKHFMKFKSFSCYLWGDEYKDPEPDGFCAWGERRES